MLENDKKNKTKQKKLWNNIDVQRSLSQYLHHSDP